jgi:DNA mismatch repair protein MutS
MARGGNDGGTTPMMAQYQALKAEAPDCLLFYRMGDFFELFFNDAEVAAACLDIALTARGEHDGRPIPMCGVPAHSADGYLARLIRAGHRVAIADQIESPAEARKRGGKALVARAITRVVTAGTLTEEVLLDARSANWLVAVAGAGGTLAVAATDVSTGRIELESVPAGGLEAVLARLDPAELIASDALDSVPAAAVPRPRSDFDSAAAEARLKAIFGVATLDGFGAFSRAELAALGGLLAYLDMTGRGLPPFLRPPERRLAGDRMEIDPATRDRRRSRRQPARRGRSDDHRRRRPVARSGSRGAADRPGGHQSPARSRRAVS